MKITKREEDGKTVLAVAGWVDTPSAGKLAQAIEGIGNVKSLVLDFDGVEYICSSGLRAVLAGYKKMAQAGGDFAVVHVRDEVMEVFRLTGFADSLNITGKAERSAGDGRDE